MLKNETCYKTGRISTRDFTVIERIESYATYMHFDKNSSGENRVLSLHFVALFPKVMFVTPSGQYLIQKLKAMPHICIFLDQICPKWIKLDQTCSNLIKLEQT